MKRIIGFCLLLFSVGISHAQNFWQQTNGPYGTGGLSFAINSNGDIYAGSLGIYRSNDNGETWTQVGMMVDEVNALATNSSGHVFAGTGISGFNGFIYRSTDNGQTWVQLGLTNQHITALLINLSGYFFAGTYVGVYRSTDNGGSWTVLPGVNSSINSLAIDSSGNIFAGGDGGRIFRSVDGGNNWSLVYSFNNYYTSSIAVSPNGHLFAGLTLALGGGSAGWVIRSTDNGVNWTQTALTNTSVSSLGASSIGHVFAGAAGGDVGFFRSTDDGATWVNTGFQGMSNIHAFAFDHMGSIFIGSTELNFGLVRRSTDNGNTWETVGLPSASVKALAANSSNDLFAGVPFGLFRSLDMGTTWSRTLYAYPTTILSVAINSNGHIFLGSDAQGIFRSIDSGSTWQSINFGLSDLYVTALVFNSQGHVFAGTYSGGVFRSTNNGSDWTQVNSGLTNTSVRSLSINASNIVFAGTTNRVFRSTDNGTSWTQSGLINNSVGALAVAPNGHVFAGGSSGTRIFRSTDEGESWLEVYSSPPTPPVSSLAINSRGHVFVGKLGIGGGILHSSDNGNTWTGMNTGLTNRDVLSLAIDSAGYVLAGTNRGGVYRSIQPTTSVRQLDKQLPADFALRQNYPNPFNPRTTIEFSLPRTEFVSLMIFDLLGKEVATLIDETKLAGVYQVEFLGVGLASGMYLYRLQAGEFIETKKLVLLK